MIKIRSIFILLLLTISFGYTIEEVRAGAYEQLEDMTGNSEYNIPDVAPTCFSDEAYTIQVPCDGQIKSTPKPTSKVTTTKPSSKSIQAYREQIQSENQIKYPSLYPTYSTGYTVTDTNSRIIYNTVLSKTDYTNFIWHSLLVSDTEEPSIEKTRVYNCNSVCENLKTITDEEFIKVFGFPSDVVITFDEKRDGYIEFVIYYNSVENYRVYGSMTAGRHQPIIEENYIPDENSTTINTIPIIMALVTVSLMFILLYLLSRKNLKNKPSK